MLNMSIVLFQSIILTAIFKLFLYLQIEVA